MFIDTHAHLTMPEFKEIDQFLARAKDAKIEAIINASFDLESSLGSIGLADKYGLIFAAVGIHPHDADKVDDKIMDQIKVLLQNKKVVAIGETGLDYYYKLKSITLQQEDFRRFLVLAQESNKPVIIHCRDAQKDTISIMKEANKGSLHGVFHCFAGDDELIQFAKDIGFYISFTGNVTFKKAHAVRENVSKVPLDMLLLETDCPYLAPDPFRGKTNEPAYIPYIAKAIAEIKGVSIEDVAARTTRNAKDLFNI
jgi:TatD DNase family protein